MAGLRYLADLLESNLDCPLPYHGVTVPITWYVYTVEAAAAARRALGAKRDEDRPDELLLRGSVGSVRTVIHLIGNQACTPHDTPSGTAWLVDKDVVDRVMFAPAREVCGRLNGTAYTPWTCQRDTGHDGDCAPASDELRAAVAS